MNKPTIAVLYEFFYPGYKAGGPIQSLVNMVQSLGHLYDFKIITTAYDLNTDEAYLNIAVNQWNQVQLPGSTSETVMVWYDAAKHPSLKKLQQVILGSGASKLFINGFYTRHFLLPLLLKKAGLLPNIGIVVSPRGMLQKGALAIKPMQKQVYLNALKLIGLCKQVVFHATTADEAVDIVNVFGKTQAIVVAGNIPKQPWITIGSTKKTVGVLKLVYLSVITPKKNLLLLLKELKQCREKVELYIYGPIKENGYWEKCLKEMNGMPINVKLTYMGHIPAHEVQNILGAYDALVLPTKGENFGHALYESLSVGTPIITSLFTPWTNLHERNAGWNIPINDNDLPGTSQLLDYLSLQGNEQWEVYKKGAFKVAEDYYYGQDFINEYKAIFEDGKQGS